MASTINVDKGNILMTFNIEGKLLGLGKAVNASTPITVEKAFTGELDLASIDPNDKYKKTVAKALLSTSFKEEYKKDDGVIVKLKGGTDVYLYIPGIIESDVNPLAVSANVIVGDGKKIIDVPLTNICSNYKLKENESGFFFSDFALGTILGGKKHSEIEDDHLNQIIKEDNYKKITITPPSAGGDIIKTDAGKEYYISHNSFTVGTGSMQKTIGTNDNVSTKSVVPMGFNMVDDIGNPESIVLTKPDDINVNKTVVFGGKQSKKQKTRKNTMPLQFAPGAKRAYLKRRKSSRK